MGDVLNPASLPDPYERYDLGDHLGGGIFGQVHVATDRNAGGKKVAVKILTASQDTEQSILDEYTILKEFCMTKPNMIDFYGVFCDRTDTPDKIWFVMEFCEGGPVIDLVRGLQVTDRKMSEEHIAFILKETIKGLTYLHENSVIHRDVRASNILMTKDGDIKLTDFGLSCRLASESAKRITVIGSPSWMAPEVVSGSDAGYGPGADVWALGITAIELADGKAPFQDMHPTRALFQIVRNPPPGLFKPSSWSNHLNDFISECLEKNPEHRPYSMELIDHPYIQGLPENDYHLSQELKMLVSEVADAGKERRMPERLVRGGQLQTENNPEPVTMHVEDLAALDNITEDTILEELQVKMSKGSFHTFIGDVLLILNPNKEVDIYNEETHKKYEFKSRSDNAPHIYAVADSAYQDALHHDEPQHIVFSGETQSGKSTSLLHGFRHLAFLGQRSETTGKMIEKAMNILSAATTAGTPINANSTRCIIQTQVTYGNSGKLSGAIFWLYQLEKWRVSSTDMSHANFNLIYYFYDGMEAAEKLEAYSLEPERKYRYLRIADPNSPPKMPCARDDPEGNVAKLAEITQYLADLDFSELEIEALWKILAAILVLGNVRFKDSNSGAAQVENAEEALKVSNLLGLDESKFSWALINYCLVERGTATKRSHSTDEARDARDVLAGTIYRRLLDWLVNTINSKLAFGRSVFGDKFSVSLLDMFGFECFHRNRLEQLIVNTMNEQMQFLYNQRLFAWEMQEQEEEEIPVVTLHFYDNKAAVDQLMARPLGLFYILDDACRNPGGQEYIMSTVKNSSKGPYVKLSGSHEFSVAHYTGKINYDARDLAEKNRDFLPPEMIETLRASSDSTVKHLFTHKLTKSGSLTAPSRSTDSEKDANTEAAANTRKYNTESKGQFSQVHRMRTAAGTFRAASLELLRALAAGSSGGCGVHFVRCVRPSLALAPTPDDTDEFAFQADVVRQQVRALAVPDTARARQAGFSTRIPFAEFIRRYKFLAFDFDENVDISRDNCRLLLVRLKMEGWVIGKTRVFLKYYNVEYLSRLYEVQVKKVVKVQCMMRAFLARRRIEKNKSIKAATESRRQEAIEMSEEDAALRIQKAFRGYAVRKAYGPLIDRSTGKIDEATAEFLRRYAAKWRGRTIFQVLLQYRAVRYQDLVNFSQQVHMFNQATMQSLTENSARVILDRIDPQAKPLEFLGPLKPAVWKLPFRMTELPFFDTTHMCNPSAKGGDTMAVGYDSEPETWDEPLRRRTRDPPRQRAVIVEEPRAESPTATRPMDRDLIHLPYSRDPAQPAKKLPRDSVRPPVYKKKQSPLPPKPAIQQDALENDDRPIPKKTTPKVDKNKNTRGGGADDPIVELRQMALARKMETAADDDAPFDFQAMLRKTPRNRASMKRSGESPQPLLSRADFKRKDSVEKFIFAIKRAESQASEHFESVVFNGNNNSASIITNDCNENEMAEETVQLAPGITVEGYVIDL